MNETQTTSPSPPSVALLACPHCGGESKATDFGKGDMVVTCLHCSAETTTVNDWNARVVVSLPVELVHKIVDALNDACTEESREVLDELTAAAEAQNVPCWFNGGGEPIWQTRSTAG